MRTAIDWAALYIPRIDPTHHEGHDLLMLFLWSQADGSSFRDICRRRGGISRSTAIRRVNWALDQIVAGLNEDATRVAA